MDEQLGYDELYKMRLDLIGERNKLQAKVNRLETEHWASLNTTRHILLNHIEELTSLVEDIRLEELALKKRMAKKMQNKDKA